MASLAIALALPRVNTSVQSQPILMTTPSTLARTCENKDETKYQLQQESTFSPSLPPAAFKRRIACYFRSAISANKCNDDDCIAAPRGKEGPLDRRLLNCTPLYSRLYPVYWGHHCDNTKEDELVNKHHTLSKWVLNQLKLSHGTIIYSYHQQVFCSCSDFYEQSRSIHWW